MAYKYYVTEVITYIDGAKDSLSIYSFDTETEAVSKFHKELGGWMGKENVKSILTVVVDIFGNVIKNETWFAPTESDTE